ncbi:MAG TPA: stage II sporulation protein D [Bacillales bacterium]|nr:stage II sporulation protein D [Bacillales bacterium]
MEVKPYLVIAGFVIGFVLILPAAIVFLFSGKEQAATGSPIENETTEKVSVPEPASTLSVSVYRAQEKTIETVPLDQYVIGVVASEMPANFELEALKAQALAARTYIVNYLLNPPDLNLPKGAEVTDTVMNQVYKDDKELKALWGSDFGWKMAKITKAVEATMGQIITYHDQPITVAFFSTSNGYTESSEAYWQSALPYLKSVPSPWDRNSPKFSSTESIPVSKVDQKLGVDIEKAGSIGNVVKSTPGHRVGKVKIAGEVFSGREVREKLGLRSTDFKMKREGDQVVITTKGWGHGVGMSQYGANGMAKQGKEYRDIIKYYYQGVSISNLHAYTAQLTAKK